MDITKLFGEMGKFQSQMETIHKQTAQLRVTKETGAGLVKLTMSGDKKLLALTIDDTLLHTKDKEMMQDLIIAAVNAALQEVDRKIQETVQENMPMGYVS